MSSNPKDQPSFNLLISRSELLAAAYVWGIAEIALPRGITLHVAPIDKVEINAGLGELKKKHLIRMSSPGKWILDNLLVFILVILNEPNAILLVKVNEGSGKKRLIYKYFHNKQSLVVIVDGQQYRFLIFKDSQSEFAWAQRWIDMKVHEPSSDGTGNRSMINAGDDPDDMDLPEFDSVYLFQLRIFGQKNGMRQIDHRFALKDCELFELIPDGKKVFNGTRISTKSFFDSLKTILVSDSVSC